MAIPDIIKNLASKVREATYGKDVRESIAKSMEDTSDVADQAKAAAEYQTGRVDNLIRNNPQPSEVVDLRYDTDGVEHETASARVASDYNKVNAQLADMSTSVTAEMFTGSNYIERINNAANYLAANGGGVIKLKSKIYDLYNITLPHNVSIEGTGYTLIKPSQDADRIFRLGSNSYARDINFVDNGKVIKACVEFGDFAKNTGMGRIYNIECTGLIATLSTAGSCGIKVGHGEDIIIKNNKLKTTANGDFGIVIHSDSPNTLENAIVADNLVDGFARGIICWGTGLRKWVVFDKNIVKNAIVTGIDVYHTTAASVTNNTTYLCRAGIWFDTIGTSELEARGNVCSGNKIYSSSFIGIYMEEIRNGLITNNTVQKSDIGIYGGASTVYTTIANNNVSYNRLGLLVSNEYVPTPMVGYDSGDLKIKDNTFAFNGEEGIILAGVRGKNIIQGNDIRANNTSNGNHFAILLKKDTIDSAGRDREVGDVTIKENIITNDNNLGVTQTAGHQRGIKNTSPLAWLTIKDNEMRNEVVELDLVWNKLYLYTNIITSTLSNPVNLYGKEPTKAFGNVGIFEGILGTDGESGLTLKPGIESKELLPSPSPYYDGRMIKVDRSLNGDGTFNPAVYYVCLQSESGAFAWYKYSLVKN